MNDYLVIIERPDMSDEQFMEFLLLYGFDEARAKTTMAVSKALGSAPGGYCEYEDGLRSQAFLADMGIESRLIYTNKPDDTVIGSMEE